MERDILKKAMQYIDMEFAIGVRVAITYNWAEKLRTMVRELPVNSIKLETDSLDMLTAGKEKGPNLPEYII